MGKLIITKKKPLTNGEKSNPQPPMEPPPPVSDSVGDAPESNDNSAGLSPMEALETLAGPIEKALPHAKGGGNLPDVVLPDYDHASTGESDQEAELVKPPDDAGDHDGKDTNGAPGVLLPDDDDDDTASSVVNLTEDDVALDFAARHSAGLRFDHMRGKWHAWANVHWKEDGTDLAFDYARKLCREHRGDKSKLASKKAAEGVERMARSDRRLAVTMEIWDRDPFLLGTPGGTVDLKTGDLREARREDFITKQTAVTPAPKGTQHPEFTKFLHDATGGDKGLQRLLQQFCGYSLTGLTNEHVLLFIYGPGGNGKSVLQNVIIEILGDYAKTAAMDTFAASKHQRHLTEIAMLCGARFVGVSETEKGQRWSEARINQLTGGDRITANFMRQDMFMFRPQFKLMVVGNHKPQLSSVNDAARRRFVIVPFMHKPEKPDLKLPEKLSAESPAVLRWMIDGCSDWQNNSLVIPEIVKATTADYFEEQDLKGRWIEERCECGPEKKSSASKLYESWKEYAIMNGEDPGSNTAFGSELKERGFEKKKSGGNHYLGIALKSISSLNYSTDI